MPYELLCVSVIGSSHVKAGTEKEDYGEVHDGGFYQIFAVADGHGDSNCPRSSFGSKIACDLAISELSLFAKTLHETDHETNQGELTTWEAKLFDEAQRDGVVHQLINSIFGKWSDEVITNIEQNPLSEDERAGCGKYIDRYDKGERLEHVYGTTLIAGLLTESYLLLLQQGDGRCAVFANDGEVTQPIPWDDKCFANVTTSLCDEDAIERCRYYVEDVRNHPVSAVLATSDGIEDSFFDMDQVHAYFREQLIYAAKNGVPELQERLNCSLPEFSEKGSNDDVTICGFIDVDRVRGLVDVFHDENYRCEIYGKIAQIDERLKSVQGKFEYDLAHYEKARSVYEEAKAAFDELNKDYSDYAEDLPVVTAAFGEGKRKESKSLLARIFGREPSDKTIDVWSSCLEAKVSDAQARIDAARKALEDAKAALEPLEEEYLKTKERREGYLAAKREYLEKIDAYESERVDTTFGLPDESPSIGSSNSQTEEKQVETQISDEQPQEKEPFSEPDFDPESENG